MAGYDNELARIVEELNRAVAGGAKPGEKPALVRAPQSSASLDQLLAFAARQNASDLLLIAGSAVALRINGALTPAAGPPLGPEDRQSRFKRGSRKKEYSAIQLTPVAPTSCRWGVVD